MKILMWDNGLNTELAITLARAGHSVAYTTPWTAAFPKASQAYIGRGLERIEVVDSFTKALDKADMVVCPDTFSEDRVAQARAAGKPTWGAGEAERMELDRPYMKELQKKLGLEVGKYDTIKGVDNLLLYLHSRDNEDRWIKTSKWRQLETFHHLEWDSTKIQYLGPLLDQYGAAADEMVWLAEHPLKGVEVGLDRLFTRGAFVEPCGWGYEAKDEAYVGTWGDCPPPLKSFVLGLARPLADANASSFVSNEAIVDSKGATMIEPTIRAPHPPTAGMLEMYGNLSKVITGKAGVLSTYAKYCAVLVIRSSWAGDHWLHIDIDPKWRHMVKLSQACRIRGKYYAVPGNEFIGYAVGLGDKLEEACSMCKKVASAVKCRDMDINEAKLDELIESTIPDGRKVGITF